MHPELNEVLTQIRGDLSRARLSVLRAAHDRLNEL